MIEQVWAVGEDRSIVDALLVALREQGVTVRGFSDPRRALEQATREPPRVLVTDYAMPQLSGVELARALRERLASDAPRIVLVTSGALRRVELTLFDHVVHKPFRLGDLVPKVQSYFATRAARRRSSHLSMRAIGSSRKAGGQGR